MINNIEYYKNTISHISIILVFLLFGSCNEKPEKTKETKEIKEELSSLEIINNNFKQVLDNLDSSLVFNFYKLNNSKLIWVNHSLQLNDKALAFIKLIENAENYGLISSSYIGELNINELNTISKDTLLTSNFIKFINHLRWGILPYSDINSPFPISIIDKKDLVINTASIFNNSSLEELIFSCSPKHSQYYALLEVLLKYNLRTQLLKDRVKVPSNKQDSTNYLIDAAKALVIHGLLDSTNVSDSLINTKIKQFQFEHGLNSDGVVGAKTAKLLSKSPFDYFITAALALDRWRKKEIWANNRIDINIPGYKLRYFKNNKVNRLHKVIIGNIKAQTIEILDSVEYLVVYPFWYVPKSIVNHEMLPKAIKDSTYFRRKGFEILIGRTVINYDKIDYNTSFRYTVRQKGGSSNALGLIKFIFPNSSSIYLHDTPSKKLFNKEVRAFSHGCIRLQNPLDLAYSVLNDDSSSYNKEKVKQLISEKQRLRINLNNHLPIYIHYTLASVLDSTIVFHEDIYKKEIETLEKLKKMFLN